MLTLHGSSSSNYHNIIKLTLLEKDVPFEESVMYSGAGDAPRPGSLRQSPIGKLPCLETEEGLISDSPLILQYLERTFPAVPMYPNATVEAATLEELMRVIDLYLKLAARRLLPNYFARKPTSEHVANEVKVALTQGAKVIAQLARFNPFILGQAFTAADIGATIHFPVVQAVVSQVLGYDPLAEVAGLPAYLARMEERPSVQRIRHDQALDRPLFIEHLQSLDHKV